MRYHLIDHKNIEQIFGKHIFAGNSFYIIVNFFDTIFSRCNRAALGRNMTQWFQGIKLVVLFKWRQHVLILRAQLLFLPNGVFLLPD